MKIVSTYISLLLCLATIPALQSAEEIQNQRHLSSTMITSALGLHFGQTACQGGVTGSDPIAYCEKKISELQKEIHELSGELSLARILYEPLIAKVDDLQNAHAEIEQLKEQIQQQRIQDYKALCEKMDLESHMRTTLVDNLQSLIKSRRDEMTAARSAIQNATQGPHPNTENATRNVSTGTTTQNQVDHTVDQANMAQRMSSTQQVVNKNTKAIAELQRTCQELRDLDTQQSYRCDCATQSLRSRLDAILFLILNGDQKTYQQFQQNDNCWKNVMELLAAQKKNRLDTFEFLTP